MYNNAKENIIQDGGEGKPKRRSERIAGRKLKDSFTNTSEDVNVNPKPKPLTDNKNKSKKQKDITTVTEPVVKRSSRSRGSKDEEKPDISTRKQSNGSNDNIPVKEDTSGIRNSLKILSVSDEISPPQVKTPSTIFKTREGIRTPLSGSRGTPGRVGVSPNPSNFLFKAEDPIVQRIQSPRPPEQSIKQEHPNVPKSAMYFHQLVEKEETKFRECCEKWNKILEEGNVPEEAHGNILAAIGQALLFQNKRFKQFKELIELHKDKSAEKAAYASDLHGFWEMIYYQVEDVHKRFAEIELLRSNNWEEKKEKLVSQPKVLKKVVVAQNEPKELKSKKPVVSSKFKLFRQQMMAKKLAAQQNSENI